MWYKRALMWAKRTFRANPPMRDECGYVVQSWTL